MSTAANPEVLKLAPSDLTFTWDECQRCFWLKVRGVLRRPSSPFPKVFGRLDRQTKALYLDKSAQQLAPELPPGQVVTGGLSVRSSPLLIPGHETAIQIAGRIDTGLAFDDGSYGIIDFKLSTPNPAHVPFYARQLHAYMAAAESPAPGALKLSPISKLGLVVVEPERMVELDDAVAYRCAKHFLPIERDDDMFAAFLVEVLTVLERPEPPEPSPGCSYCTYLKAGSLVLMTEFYGGGT